jgi:MYXO-CTERM domain-containing protein
MKRITAFLSIAVGLLVLGFGAFSQASASTVLQADDPTFTSTWNGAGSELLPCEGTVTWEFSLAGPTMASSAELSVDGVTHPGTQTSDFSWEFTSPGSGLTAASTVFVTYTAPHELFESAIGILRCDNEETTPPTETTPTETTPTETTPTETTPTETTVSTLPSESTRPTTSSVLPSESTRPIPTAIDAGISGPTSGSGGSSPLIAGIGMLAGLALAVAGAFALIRRRGQHEA